jgi:hypothetical protein
LEWDTWDTSQFLPGDCGRKDDSRPRENLMKDDLNADPARGTREVGRVNGWEGIAERVSARAGLPVSVDSVTRYSRRAKDRLPVRKWGARVYAVAADLDAWTDRQFRDDIGPSPPSSPGRGR